MHAVPRERFVPASERARAHIDAPLPIGLGQTISQPSLVARMTEQLALTPHSRVLEVGTGSGYQTAILAEIAAEVFTIERLPELADAAQGRLTELGYRNIRFKAGDGALGWPEAAPFDAIIVTAAALTLPPALPEQLRPGGKLIVPLGSVAHDNQVLVRIEKDMDGAVHRHDLYPVRFVPLVSDTPGQA
jgi:protein-L-isoaspartate(D-aspartate) O-methyltransferase